MSRAAIAGAIGRLARISLASTNAAKNPGLKSNRSMDRFLRELSEIAGGQNATGWKGSLTVASAPVSDRPEAERQRRSLKSRRPSVGGGAAVDVYEANNFNLVELWSPCTSIEKAGIFCENDLVAAQFQHKFIKPLFSIGAAATIT